MAKIERFEDIEAWKEARKLSAETYTVTRSRMFRADRSLADQIRRSSVSIMANIVEGFDSDSSREFLKYLAYALRSASELQSHLYVSLDQAYISTEAFGQLYEQARTVKKLIGGFRRYLRSLSPPRKPRQLQRSQSGNSKP
jgi:four helix bundle protein